MVERRRNISAGTVTVGKRKWRFVDYVQAVDKVCQIGFKILIGFLLALAAMLWIARHVVYGKKHGIGHNYWVYKGIKHSFKT
jgi:hypothetical protein